MCVFLSLWKTEFMFLVALVRMFCLLVSNITQKTYCNEIFLERFQVVQERTDYIMEAMSVFLDE